MMGVEAIKNERFKAKNRGVEFRYITEITGDNISYCKELSKISEIRHLNGVKGNFEVSQNIGKAEYIGTAVLQEAEPVPQLIYSNVKEIVEQQQYVFDTLWNKAIPSQVRIKEIEEGIKPETIEVIVDPRNALEAEYRLLKSAKKEIQMIFSTVNTFHMQERQLGITKILTNLSNQGVSIKILTPIDDKVRELIADLKEQADVKKLQQQQRDQKNNHINNNNDGNDGNDNLVVDIQNIAPSSSINAKIIVVDKQDSLAMEIKDGVGDSLHTTIGLSTLSNSKSTIASYSAIFENLSKQNQLYKQLKEAYLTVEYTNAVQKEFINVAAHELRTPVQPILGYAELLLEEETNDNKKQALMGIIHNSNRLQKLASNILDVARMDSNTFQLYKEPLNLNYVMSNIVKDYVKMQEQKKAIDITNINHGNNEDKDKDNVSDDSSKKGDLKLFFESKVKEDIFVEADKDRLTQVICNLLDNAFKFTEGHGESIQITLEKQEPHHELLVEQRIRQQQERQQEQEPFAIISIKDTGTGIDPEISPRLFSKFATKSHKGTGLGLYISKNIIEAHGGRLYASNNYDRGATFTITLPLFMKQK